MHVSASGQEGLKIAYEIQPGLVIVGMNLPDMKGWDVSVQLRLSPLLSETPVLLCSKNQIDVKDKMAVFHSGVNDFMVWPFELSDLTERVKTLIRSVDSKPKHTLALDISSLIHAPATTPTSGPTQTLFSAPTTPSTRVPPPRIMPRLWDVLNTPRAAFLKLNENSDFIIAVIVIAATTILNSFAKMIQKADGFDTWIGIFSLSLVLNSLAWFVIAWILHMVLPFEDVELPMKKSLALVGLGWTPRLLEAVFSFGYSVIALIVGNPSASVFSAGIDIVPGVPFAPWVDTISKIGVFDLWCVTLTLLGVWSVYQREERKWNPATITTALLSLLCGALINS